MIKANVIPSVMVNYLPSSKYQFYIEFEFNGLFAIPVFEFSIQFNPEYKQYFKDADMSEQHIVRVDPALLARPKVEKRLTFDENGNLV